MKLRNKKTGEIGYTAVLQSKAIIVMDENAIQLGSYTSLAELNSEWEDVPEEPKEYWFIDEFGLVQKEIEYYYEENKEAVHDKRIAVGNYFETREEAEEAVEKLKAWKRLKDKGFRFTGCSLPSDKGMCICYETDIETWSMQDLQDFKTLFGGE